MRAPTDHETAALDALVTVARPIILREFRADSCIASCRLAMDALTYFGITTIEQPVTAMVINHEAAALLSAGTTMQELSDILVRLSPETPGGPWTIGVGVGSGAAGTWSGHLIVTVPDIRAVIDLSIDQASRPHKNISLEPYWGVVDRDDWWEPDASRESTLFPVASPDGSVIMLDRHAVDPMGYRVSPNWTRSGQSGKAVYRALAGQIIREMKPLVG